MFFPAPTVQEVLPKLEEAMYGRLVSNKGPEVCLGKARDAAFLTNTFSTIQRGDNAWRTDLSDNAWFSVPAPTRAMPMPVFVAAQPFGKTNQGCFLVIFLSRRLTHTHFHRSNAGRTLYSRATRNVDAKICGPGHNAYYLICRWRRHREMETFDFTENASWFDVKLYCDAGCKAPTKVG